MELSRRDINQYQQPTSPSKTFHDLALGLISTRSYPAIIGTADMMLKSSGVVLIGIEKIGEGHCTAIIRGNIANVRLAVESGIQTANQFGQYISSTVIPRPLGNLDVIFPIGKRILHFDSDQSFSRLSNQAIGLLETRGFPALVGACDAMLKSAEVHLAAYETIGDALCTAIIRGTVADVAVAVEAGMHAAERIGEFHSLMVIPRPLDDLEQSLPVASCWLEAKPKPLQIPLQVKEKEKELVELPELSQLPAQLPVKINPPPLPNPPLSKGRGGVGDPLV